MALEGRLRQLESRIRPAYTIPEYHFDLDQCIERLGLAPVAVRELASSKGSSLIEAMCEMLGIEVREFKNELRDVANLAR